MGNKIGRIMNSLGLTLFVMFAFRSGVVFYRMAHGIPNPAPLPLPEHLLLHAGIFSAIFSVMYFGVFRKW